VSGPFNPANPVKVLVYEGPTPFGKVVGTATGTVVSGKWASGNVSPELSKGKRTYTVVATTPSSIGNAEGKSAAVSFVVNTERPSVVLNQPAPLSNEATPSFSGTASEPTPVEVAIYKGAKAEGTPVAKASGSVTGSEWKSPALGEALKDGEYTAIATQQSAIHNPPGSSQALSFTINTKPPAIALAALPTPSSNREPSFSGTASDHEPVIVDLYNGAYKEGATVVASVEAEVSGGEWVSHRLLQPLEWGTYTAVARQRSSIGNAPGASPPVTFVVEAIPPVAVTEAATEVTRTSAALYAAVNPKNGPVSSCKFEFGPTPGYGKSVECGFVAGLSAFPERTNAAVPVFARIYGLHPSTTYHVRIVAVGEGGTADGADQTFTTREPLPEEHVTPPPPPGPKGGVLSWSELKPKAAKIAALLKKGGFSEQFTAPEPGTVVLRWYYLPRGTKFGGKGKHAPVLVAAGKVTFTATGTKTVRLTLTHAGIHLLRSSKRIRLTATGSFTPATGQTDSMTAQFQLSR
jgi:hypothetical protein